MLFNLFITLPQLIRVVYTEKVTLIHSNCNDMHLPAIIVGKLMSIPIVIHDRLYIKKIKHQIIDFLCGLFSNQIISVSEAMKNKLNLPNYSKNNVAVVYDGINPNDFSDDPYSNQSIKKEFGIKDSQITLGTLARISPEKGLEYLIESFHIIKKEYPNTKLIIVGDIYSDADTTYKHSILNLIKDLHLQNDVILAGYQSDISKIIQSFDISVSSSLMESFGMFILESMVSCKAIVATKVGGVPEVVKDGKTAILVKPRDIKSMSKALSILISDEKKRTKLGKFGRKRALKHFSINRTINQLENIYNGILN